MTYVGEPEAFDLHLADLARLQALGARWVLPNHGAAEVIAAGGYGAGLLSANAEYIALLQAGAPDDMRVAIADRLGDGTLRYFAPYAAVHAQNLDRVRAALG